MDAPARRGATLRMVHRSRTAWRSTIFLVLFESVKRWGDNDQGQLGLGIPAGTVVNHRFAFTYLQ